LNKTINRRSESWELQFRTDELYRKWRDEVYEALPENQQGLYKAAERLSGDLWDGYSNGIPLALRESIASFESGRADIQASIFPDKGIQEELPASQTTKSKPLATGLDQINRPSSALPTSKAESATVTPPSGIGSKTLLPPLKNITTGEAPVNGQIK
jgi:hypothetical protein